MPEDDGVALGGHSGLQLFDVHLLCQDLGIGTGLWYGLVRALVRLCAAVVLGLQGFGTCPQCRSIFACAILPPCCLPTVRKSACNQVIVVAGIHH